MAEISIIVTGFNQEDYIGHAIESVLAQTISDFECIFVDDGSDDETYAIACRYAEQDPRVRAFTKPNGGVSSARNMGVSHTSPECKFLTSLDGDDALDPRFLEVMVPHLRANPQIGLLCCGYREIDEAGRDLGVGHRSRYVPGRFFLPRQLTAEEPNTPFVAFYCATGQGPFALFRRSVFDQTEGWALECTPHEDTDIFCQMALKGEVHYLPDLLYVKRDHPKSVTSGAPGSTDGLKFYKANAYDLFRQRWLAYKPATEEERRTIDAAHRHYLTRHRPLRHCKVGTRAFGEFVRSLKPERLRWSATLFYHGLRDLVGYNLLGWSTARHPERPYDNVKTARTTSAQ